MKADLRTHIRHGAVLGGRRFRSAHAIAEHSGYSLHATRMTLREMERRGEVEVKRGVGRVKKVYRRSR